MRLPRPNFLFLAALALMCGPMNVGERAEAQLRWPPPPKKEQLRVRLVALALSDPRSSFFSSHEVLIAEKEIGKDEWSLVKLVYTFLPYQPRLSESGFDYSIVHELEAARDPNCDETLEKMTTRESQDHSQINMKYAVESPVSDLERRRTPLPCYEMTADDYGKAVREPLERQGGEMWGRR